MLEVSVRHDFPGFALDAAFRAPPGITVLFGRSGSGKTSIVNAVAGLLMPDAGRIASGDWTLLDTERGVRLRPHRRRLACQRRRLAGPDRLVLPHRQGQRSEQVSIRRITGRGSPDLSDAGRRRSG
mgnify:CR=1 FL=1